MQGMNGMMHHGQQFGAAYGSQRTHPNPNMHVAMNGMNIMNQNSSPMHANMMASGVGVLAPAVNNMNKLVLQVTKKCEYVYSVHTPSRRLYSLTYLHM